MNALSSVKQHNYT